MDQSFQDVISQPKNMSIGKRKKNSSSVYVFTHTHTHIHIRTRTRTHTHICTHIPPTANQIKIEQSTAANHSEYWYHRKSQFC